MLAVAMPLQAQQAGSQSEQSRQEELRKKREQRKANLTPYDTSTGEKRVLWWETNRFKAFTKGYKGIRPVIGGMDDPVVFGAVSSGSGLVGGIGYQRGLDSQDFRFSIDARYSTKQYESLEALAEFPTPRSDSPVQAYLEAAYRDYKEINFFGLGPDSSPETDSTFRIEDRRFGGGLRFFPNRAFFLETGWARLNTHLLPGPDESGEVSAFDIERAGDLEVLRGRRAPEYDIYGGTFGFNFFDREYPEVGAGIAIGVERFDDRKDDLFNFTKISADFSTEIPLKYRNRRIAFKIRTVHHMPDAGNNVPFYMLETIGGGTTFRGFSDYRFRDRRYLLMNLEYRWEAWTYADFAIFADGGKVFRRARDLDFTDLEAGYGFGILIRTPFEGRLGRYGRLRIDIANSREGFRFYIGSGPAFGRRHPPRVK